MILKFLIFILTSIIGTLLHFTYKLSKNKPIIGLFSSINESTFEHTKIALFSRLFVSLIEVHYFLDNSTYYFSILLEMILISILIPLLYYTYKIIFKKDNTIYNISIFYITLIISNIIGTKILISNVTNFITIHSPLFILIYIIILIYLTINPPKLLLFKDPNSKSYGIKKMD